jgi:hypothetical protein
MLHGESFRPSDLAEVEIEDAQVRLSKAMPVEDVGKADRL